MKEELDRDLLLPVLDLLIPFFIAYELRPPLADVMPIH